MACTKYTSVYKILFLSVFLTNIHNFMKSSVMKSESKIIILFKKLLTFLLFIIGISNFTSAQDIITLKTGEEINAKVKAVEMNVITYTNFNDQTGPVYTVYKADVFMIKYENGAKDVYDYHEVKPVVSPSQNDFNVQADGGEKLTYTRGNVMRNNQKLRPFEVKAIMNTNYDALKRYKGGRAFKTLGIIFLVIGGIDIGTGIANTFQAYDATTNFLVGGVEIGVGLIFGSVSKNKTDSSVILYNRGLKDQHPTSLNLGINRNGLGLCLNF